MPKYLLAHDLGTSGNKATLYTTEGQLVKSAVYSYDTRYFNQNWAEQNADDWWEAVCVTTKNIMEGINKEDVLAVSFSGQMMGCLCVDKNGVPLRDAIIWADMRAVQEAGAIKEKIGSQEFYRITGHRPSASYSIEKLMWVKNHEPEIYRNTYKMLNAKDYIIYKLTGQFVTEYSDASGTNALDLNTFEWSDDIIDASGIDGDKLPVLKESTYVVGNVSSKVADEIGLSTKTAVVCGGGDGLCSAVGAGCVEEGIAYNYIGSSSWIAITTDKPIFDEKMRTFNWAHIIPGKISPCGTMQAAGGSYSWLKNEICKIECLQAEEKGVSPYDIINQAVEKSPVGARGLIYLPYLMGERSPRWNPNARGGFIGLTMEHKREDLFRAVLEGVTMNLNIILGIFKEHEDIKEMIVIGGGAKGRVWRQILADVYGLKILKPNYLEEATSMGAAITAGVGIGVFKDFSVTDKFIRIEDVQQPTPSNQDKYRKMMDIFDSCYYALEDIFDKLSV